MPRSILDYFDVSLDFLTDVVVGNPSLRGMVLGYVAEAKLKEILTGHGRATAFRKDDDHDRKKKGDLVVTYEGFEFKIEVKSVRTHEVEMMPEGGEWIRKILKQKGPERPNPDYAPLWERHRFEADYRGRLQCDASDKRLVTFLDGTKLETANLLFGEFHILAAGIFTFREKWEFGFALNRELPASTNRKYTPYQREQLILNEFPITWPLQPPFVEEIYVLLDRLVTEEQAKQKGLLPGTETEIVVEPPVASSEVVEEPHVTIVEKKRKKKS